MENDVTSICGLFCSTLNRIMQPNCAKCMVENVDWSKGGTEMESRP